MPHAQAETAESTITLRLPGLVHSRLRQQAGERGYSTPEAYALDLIDSGSERAERDDSDRLPFTPKEVERLALEGLMSGPARPLTPEVWAEIRARSRELARAREAR